jgi:hypothetical protein
MTYRNSEGYADPTAGTALARIERDRNKHQYRPLVYICSKYAGDVMNNIISARDYCRFAAMSGYIPVASHLLFTQFLRDENPEERRLGLFFGNILMDKCDEVWIFGLELSAGMKAEYDRAKRKGYKIRRFTADCREVTANGD